jgi:hypothetical protein
MAQVTIYTPFGSELGHAPPPANISSNTPALGPRQHTPPPMPSKQQQINRSAGGVQVGMKEVKSAHLCAILKQFCVFAETTLGVTWQGENLQYKSLQFD